MASQNSSQKMLVEITTDGVPKLHCPVCNKALVSLAGYVKHVKKHEPPGGFQCRHCDAQYCHDHELKQHVRSVHGPLRCLQCVGEEIVFNSKAELDAHIEETHQDRKFNVGVEPSAKSFQCELCGKSFESDGIRLAHKHATHTNELPVSCVTCALRFTCHSSLIKHQRKHPTTCGNLNLDQTTVEPELAALYVELVIPEKRKRGRPKKSTSKYVPHLPPPPPGPEFSEDDDIPLAKRLNVKPSHLKQETLSSLELSDSSDEYPDIEPTDSDDDMDVQQLKLPSPAVVKVESTPDAVFEYQDGTLYVKEENSGLDIFSNEKDKLLDVLLSTEESAKPFENLKMEHAAGILDEIAAVPMAKHNGSGHIEEDVLALKDADSSDDGRKSHFFVSGKRRFKRRNPNAESDDDYSPSRERVSKLTKKELRERMKVLNKMEKSWQCPHCVKIYHIRKPFEKHLREDHKLSEENIQDTFNDMDELASLDKDVFKCKICSKIYLVAKRLETHMSVHGIDGSLVFKCPCYCNRFFASKEEATEHAQMQHKELLYCEKCDKFMTGHESLKNHQKNFHDKRAPRNLERNLICDKCGKKFCGRTPLSDHVRSECGRVPLYECSVCKKRLSTAGILKTHMLLHQAESPYQCDKCGKTFKVKAQYKSHLKTRHTDYKPYKCHLCPKEYPYRESLLTHMTVHTGIKRFLCNNCGKRFTCISNLQAHRKVHADTCGQLPLNAKATQYMGVQRGKLLMGAKPEAGMGYEETKTLIAQDVIDRDMPMAQELNFPSDGIAPLATVTLNCASTHLMPNLVLQKSESRRHD